MIPGWQKIQQGMSDKDALLAQLSDIQLPAPVGFWPPAPGWWVLFLFCVLMLTGAIYYLYRHRVKTRHREAALRMLNALERQYQAEELHASQHLSEVTALLKRCFMRAYPHARNKIAGAFGKPFYTLLRATNPKGKTPVDPAWYEGIYQKNKDFDCAPLNAFAREWIQHHTLLDATALQNRLQEIDAGAPPTSVNLEAQHV